MQIFLLQIQRVKVKSINTHGAEMHLIQYSRCTVGGKSLYSCVTFHLSNYKPLRWLRLCWRDVFDWHRAIWFAFFLILFIYFGHAIRQQDQSSSSSSVSLGCIPSDCRDYKWNVQLNCSTSLISSINGAFCFILSFSRLLYIYYITRLHFFNFRKPAPCEFVLCIAALDCLEVTDSFIFRFSVFLTITFFFNLLIVIYFC